jgi:putative ABC transport system permease protein
MRFVYKPLLDSYAAPRRAFTGLYRGFKMSPTAPPATVVSQQALTGVDPNLVVSEPQALQDVIDESLMFLQLPGILFGTCGLMRLLIASIGIYGVMSFAVTRRFKEIGIRQALGAQAARIVQSVVSHGAGVAAAGLAVGLATGYGLARVAESFVPGLIAADLLAYAGVAAIILTVALVASAVPAIRAASINPSETLRSE